LKGNTKQFEVILNQKREQRVKLHNMHLIWNLIERW